MLEPIWESSRVMACLSLYENPVRGSVAYCMVRDNKSVYSGVCVCVCVFLPLTGISSHYRGVAGTKKWGGGANN